VDVMEKKNLVPVSRFFFSITSTAGLGFTQPPFQWVPGQFLGVKEAGA